MKWRKLKKYIREHPYLVDDAYKLSMHDAQKIIDEGNAMSFEEMIRSAMVKSSIPACKWEESVPALNRGKKPIYRKRKALIGIACLAAVILFFAVVPIGRTWAKGAIDFVVRIFSGNVVVENQNGSALSDGKIIIGDAPPKPSEQTGSEEIEVRTKFNSFEELYEKTRLSPIIVAHPSYAITSIEYYSDADTDTKRVTVIYSNKEYGEMVTHQYWDADEGMLISLEEDYFTKKVLPEQYTMYCCITPKDNWFNGSLVIDNSVFTIGFSAEADMDNILKHVSYYTQN